MKKIILITVLLVTAAAYQTTSAQIGISASINIGVQPAWGPAGYNYAQYYYIPAIDCYYDVADAEYVYLVDGQWVFSEYLPPMYADFDMYNCYKVVINSPNPWMNHPYYVQHYAQYRDNHSQPVNRQAYAPRATSHTYRAPERTAPVRTFAAPAPRTQAPRPEAPAPRAPAPRAAQVREAAPRSAPMRQAAPPRASSAGHRGR